ncbi:MAG TPA: MFS transporter [Candidatus Lokiarchaeia archaeon]|nr:MFS transporter [Candidatus Lokiarchaeia archaeon]
MVELPDTSNEDYTTKRAVSYSLAGFTDVILFQFFSFLIFTFYYSVVGLNVNLITLAFVIWSVWNAFNDPLLGGISDRTHTKWGRRKPFIVAGILPLLVINILLWTPPVGNDLITFAYFLAILCLNDFFYTMYSVNQTSLFPEMFRNLDQRAKANTWVQFLQILALMIAFLLPSFFIPNYTDPKNFPNYMFAAVVISGICLISAIAFIKYGLKERPEYAQDFENNPSFLQSFKITLKNKSFLTYVVGIFALWYAFGMIPAILPLYGRFVLNIDNSTILSLLLATGFISAAVFISVWRIILQKLAAKVASIIAQLSFIATLLPFMFISDVLSAFIAFIFLGFGLAGALIVRDVTIAVIIDEDELKTGVRREGAFYGVNGFVAKLTNVVIFLSISTVFNSVGWAIFNPLGTTDQTIFGLRSLLSLFPIVLLVLGIIAMAFFPINKAKYAELTTEAKKLHEQKSEAVKNQSL